MSEKPIDLMSVNIDQIVVSDKFNHNEDGFKYFIGYQKGEILKMYYFTPNEWVYKIFLIWEPKHVFFYQR